MLKGGYTPGPVIDAKLRIFVDGVERPHLSASWEGNTSGGLPSSLIAAGDSVYSRTGSIVWAPETAVVEHPLAPVGETRWGPRQGASVRIVAVVDGVEFPRFWGFLGASTYDILTDTVTTQISDNLQAGLQEIVSIQPMAELQSYGRTAWVAYRAIEQAGYGVLPPVTEDTVLQNSHQYGAAAAVGKMATPGAEFGSPDGLAGRKGQTTAADGTVSRDGRDVMIYSRLYNRNVDASVEVTFTDGARFIVSYNAATKTFGGWSSATGAMSSWPAVGERPVMAVKLNARGVRRWLSAAEDDSELVEATKVTTTANVASVTANMLLGVKIDYLRDWLDGGRRVGMMARPVPRLWLSALEQMRVPATRGFENVTCESIVSSWCQATLSTVWVDEEGRLNIAARDQLATGTVTVTDPVSERVFGGSWKTARDGVRSSVTLKGKNPAIQGNGVDAVITAWAPDNLTEIPANKDLEIFVQWPDDVDVLGLDTNFRPVVKSKSNIFDFNDFNAGRGSWWGISFENQEDPPGYRWTGNASNHEDIFGKLEKLGQRTAKMTLRVQKKSSGGPEKYYLCTPSLGADELRFGNRARPLPILRCHTRVTWTDYTLKRLVRDAPPAAAPFTLDAGWWLHEEDARRVVGALTEELGVERITLDGLEMLWDPRKQIGDTVALDAGRWGVEALITGYREAWEGSVPTHSLDLQVKKVTSGLAGKTYGDMEHIYRTYADIPAGKTYGDIYGALPGKVK